MALCPIFHWELKKLPTLFHMVHNSCFRNPSAYSFSKILNAHFSKGYCKYWSEKEQEQDIQIAILWIFQLNQFERLESYWMLELQFFFHVILTTRLEMSLKLTIPHINVTSKFHFAKNRKLCLLLENHKDFPFAFSQ